MANTNPKKKNLGNFPFVSVVFTLFLGLILIGFMYILYAHSKGFNDQVQQQMEMQVFLDKYASENQVLQLKKLLSDQPFLLQNADSLPISYLSKEEAARQWIEKTGEDFDGFLGENPLHNSYRILIDPAYQDSVALSTIERQLMEFPGVFEVSYSEDFVGNIIENLNKVISILIAMGILVFVIAVLLINNTIKLALFSQRFLIRSMQLVGATKGFIRKPFVVRSVIYGIGASLLAFLFLYLIVQALHGNLPQLEVLFGEREYLILAIVLVVTGSLIALFSTSTALNRYLKLSLDELY